MKNSALILTARSRDGSRNKIEKSKIYLPDISVCISDKPSTGARGKPKSRQINYNPFYLISASISTPCLFISLLCSCCVLNSHVLFVM